MQKILLIFCLLLLQPSYILGDCYSEPTTLPLTTNCNQPQALTVAMSSLPGYVSGTQKATIIASVEILDMCSNSFSDQFSMMDISNPTKNFMANVAVDSSTAAIGYYVTRGDGPSWSPTSSWTMDFSVGGLNEFAVVLDFTRAGGSQLYYSNVATSADTSSGLSYAAGPFSYANTYTFDDITLTFCCNYDQSLCYSCKLHRLAVVYKGLGSSGYALSGLSFGIKPKLIGEYKFQDVAKGYSLTDSTGVTGTAYLGASTASTSDTTNSPTWTSERPALSFTANQFVTLPPFTIASSGFGNLYSMTLSFWLYWTSSSSGYIWRRSSNDLATDKFALKVTSSGALTGIIGTQSKDTTLQPISTDVWTHILVHYRMDTLTGSNSGRYTQVFFAKDLGQTVMTTSRPPAMMTTGTVTFAADDAIYLGGPAGFVGRLADVKIFSPGTIEVFSPAICSPSASCTSHLGVSNPPLCLSATCATTCDVSGGGTNNACFGSGDTSCLGCASGSYFYKNLCQACDGDFQTSNDYCVCPATSVSYQQQCLSSCPAATFESSGACASCSNGCQTCTSASSCQVCKNGYTLTGSSCAATETSSSSSSSGSGTPTGTIVGAVVGSVGGVVLVALAALYFKKKAAQRAFSTLPVKSPTNDAAFPA